MTGISQNLCGLPEQSAWELCSAGYDIVSMQETHGDEQRKSHWPQGQLFETMLQSYIRPFEHFPYSRMLAELYDDLSPTAPVLAAAAKREEKTKET